MRSSLVLTRLCLLLVLAAPASAQRAPDAQALLDGWAADWRRAARSVEAIEAEERMTRTVDGPRGDLRIETESTVRYDRDGAPSRGVTRLRVNGRDRDPRDRRTRGRFGRAFGPAGRDVVAPPLLPGVAFADAEAGGIEADRLGGTPAWRVDLRLGDRPDRATAWFSRGPRPRLLRVRFEGARPGRGRYERTVEYARVDGLDLAVATETAVTVRQRRRLRSYEVTLTSEGRYSAFRLRER